MPTSGFQGDVLSLVLHSGPMAQFIIFVLLGFSTVSWAIMVERYRVIQRSERESAAFVTKFRAGSSLGDLRDFAEKLPHAPAAAIYRAGFRQINAVGNPKVPAAAGPTRDPMASIERVLVRAATEEQARLERSLPFLATTAAACPFIGLFGTVWGIMSAFHAIGGMGSASLAVVAPGISEALVTTAAGLAAAIPAVIGYNYFLNRIRAIGTRMDNFVADFLTRAESTIYS
ncbi:MAG TPA: MotA/TolQ/ExbB proton channel family protein [Verrucomicrobiae bacterium]|nr:MotA/TolQ/ExbB proton channel family protein [Verrucomicrobiae bacterium]